MRTVSFLSWVVWEIVALAGLGAVPSATPGDEPAEAVDRANDAALRPDPPGLKRLHPQYPVWLDPKNRRVVMVGQVCLREGPLEMFACLKGTKEHESIVAVPTSAYIVHAALLRLGANPGNPARFVPDFQPARGTRIDVTLFWTDDGMRRRARAQDWVRHARTGKALADTWVFGGSGFWEDEKTGQQHYQAEQGDFICISNFGSAMLDLPVESSGATADLLFEAFTDRIPPLGTRVTVVLTPRPQPNDPQLPDPPRSEEAPATQPNEPEE